MITTRGLPLKSSICVAGSACPARHDAGTSAIRMKRVLSQERIGIASPSQKSGKIILMHVARSTHGMLQIKQTHNLVTNRSSAHNLSPVAVSPATVGRQSPAKCPDNLRGYA